MIYAEEVMDLYPWFHAANTGGLLLWASSSQHHYGAGQLDSQDDALTWEVSLRAGTYALTDLCYNSPEYGISSIANGGAALATLDKYAGSGAYNQRETASVALAPGEISATTSTRHASATAWYNDSTYIRLERTGD